MSRQITDSRRCSHTNAANRRCRMPRTETHPSLCFEHARKQRQALEAERAGRELASISSDLRTASDLNFVLSRLFAEIAKDRIKPRKAATLAYVGQLLLGTLDKVSREASWTLGNERWRQIVSNSHLLNRHVEESHEPELLDATNDETNNSDPEFRAIEPNSGADAESTSESTTAELSAATCNS